MTGLAKSGVRLELELAAARTGVVLDQVVEVATLEVARRLMLDGLGCTVHFAAPIRAELEAGRLAAVSIDGLQIRRILARPAARPSSRAGEEVLAILQKVIGELVASGGWPHARLTEGVAGAPDGTKRQARRPSMTLPPTSVPGP